MSEENPQDESIDTFIIHKGNEFLETFKNTQKMKSLISTPTNKSDMNGSFSTPQPNNSNPKCHINKIENNKNLDKSESQDVINNPLNENYKSKTPNITKIKRTYRTSGRRNESNNKNSHIKNHVVLEQIEKSKESNIFELLTERVIPLITLVKNDHLSRSVERDLSKVAEDYRNDKPFRYATPRPNK